MTASTTLTIAAPDPQGARAQTAMRDLQGLVLVLLILASCFMLLQTHLSMHTGHGIAEIVQAPAIHLREFGFVGGGANGYSVALEITIWSLMGLHCRMAYIIGRATLVGEVQFIRMLTMWLSTAVFGWGTTTAVVSLLYLIKLDVGTVTIGLSRIEAIVTVSFILGFYNDETRRALGAIRRVFRQAAVMDDSRPQVVHRAAAGDRA